MHACTSTLLVLTIAVAGCDIVSTSYRTKGAAIGNGLVAGGALPMAIPDSSYDLHTRTDLDGNTSTGAFRFSAADADAFAGALTKGRPVSAPFRDWNGTMRKFERDGYELRLYSEEHAAWAFFCRFAEGDCKYYMWRQ